MKNNTKVNQCPVCNFQHLGDECPECKDSKVNSRVEMKPESKKLIEMFNRTSQLEETRTSIYSNDDFRTADKPLELEINWSGTGTTDLRQVAMRARAMQEAIEVVRMVEVLEGIRREDK